MANRTPTAPSRAQALPLLSPLLLLATASAADLRLQVAPDTAPRSIVAMSLDSAGQVSVAGCRDDGTAGDERVDGIWTCDALDAADGEARAALALDGELVELGGVLVAPGGTTAQVQLEAGRAVMDTEGGLLTANPSARARPMTPLVLVRATGDWSTGAPMLRLGGPGGSGQASCRDDGTFPDRTRNDGEIGCAGPAAGDPALPVLQPAGAAPIELGRFSADGAVVGVTWADGAATRGAISPWPWPAEGIVVTEPEPGPDPTPPEAPDPVAPEHVDQPDHVEHVEHVEHEGTSTPVAPQPLVGRDEAPQALAGASDTAGRGLVDFLAVLGALGAGFGLAWVVGPRRNRLPAGVERVDAPPVFEGGPGLSEPVAVYATDSGKAFLAELVTRVASRRPVLVVGESLPPTEGIVYRSTSVEWEQVAAQAAGLTRTTRLPLAIVVLGRDTLTSPGAVADDGARLLADNLPPGTHLAFVLAPGDAPVGSLAPWTATHDAGWKVTSS